MWATTAETENFEYFYLFGIFLSSKYILLFIYLFGIFFLRCRIEPLPNGGVGLPADPVADAVARGGKGRAQAAATGRDRD